jgi:hypothetical protein
MDLEIVKLDFSLSFLKSSKEFSIQRKFPTISKTRMATKKLVARLIDKDYLEEYDLVTSTKSKIYGKGCLMFPPNLFIRGALFPQKIEDGGLG